jgi:uncharacterized coiled-coil protein SlyX
MPTKEMAERHLREADKRIARAEIFVARQRRILAKFEANGRHGTRYARDARAILDTMLNTLEAMRSNRSMILDELNDALVNDVKEAAGAYRALQLHHDLLRRVRSKLDN